MEINKAGNFSYKLHLFKNMLQPIFKLHGFKRKMFYQSPTRKLILANYSHLKCFLSDKQNDYSNTSLNTPDLNRRVMNISIT